MVLKYFLVISISSLLFTMASCSGSKKYFKAAEKLEEQGLIDEAATYYQESLQRKSKNTDARIKLKEVGQKYVNNLSSDFFREYSTQQFEQAIQTYDKLRSFTSKSSALYVIHNYPQSYCDDYDKALAFYLNKYYNETVDLVNQNKYDQALRSISKIKKYNTSYKNTQELEVISKCEPLYISAIKNIEAKNYNSAKNNLTSIAYISTGYKDCKELMVLMDELLKKTFLILQPKNSSEKDIEEKLFDNFIDLSNQNNNKTTLINNSPFLYLPGSVDVSSSDNIELLQAIKKASGADFFYVFDVANKKESISQPTKGTNICYEKTVTKKDTIYITEYKRTSYYQIKEQCSYSYDFKYKIINALTNQIMTSRTETFLEEDHIDYYQFSKSINSNINNFTPYNPAVTPIANQYDPSGWRAGFSNRKELRSIIDLKNTTDNKAINLFSQALYNYLAK